MKIIIEGTPEELAQYFKKLSKSSKSMALTPGVNVGQLPAIIPYVSIPPTIECQHEYESPWMGIIPPSCKKCGKAANPSPEYITITSSDNGTGNGGPIVSFDKGYTAGCAGTAELENFKNVEASIDKQNFARVMKKRK